MTTFTFNSKETYLQYRKNWKQKYAALSQTIRDLNWCRKYAHKGTARYLEIRKRHETQWGFYPHSLAVHTFRPVATALLEELREAKKEAQLQYLAQKVKTLANA